MAAVPSLRRLRLLAYGSFSSGSWRRAWNPAWCHVRAGWLARTPRRRSRNLPGSSRCGVCAELSNQTRRLSGAWREPAYRCAASPGATWSCRPCTMTTGTDPGHHAALRAARQDLGSVPTVHIGHPRGDPGGSWPPPPADPGACSSTYVCNMKLAIFFRKLRYFTCVAMVQVSAAPGSSMPLACRYDEISLQLYGKLRPALPVWRVGRPEGRVSDAITSRQQPRRDHVRREEGRPRAGPRRVDLRYPGRRGRRDQ